MPRLEMATILGASVVRDCSFDRLGYDFASQPGTLAFAVTSNHAARAGTNPCVVGILTTPTAASMVPSHLGLAVVQDPRAVFYELNESMAQSLNDSCSAGTSPGAKLDPLAHVHPAAEICEGTSVGPFAVIESNVTVSRNCVVSAGAKIGTDGILFSGSGADRRRIKHYGSVIIGDGAILQPDCVVMRAVLVGDSTHVGNGVVVGAHAVIGHDARVDDSAVISNGCIVARGATIGSGAFLGSGAVVREYTTIGPGARVLAGSVVVRDVPPASTVSGNFAEAHLTRMRGSRREARHD